MSRKSTAICIRCDRERYCSSKQLCDGCRIMLDRAAHPEESAAKKRAWYDANKERLAAKDKIRRQANPEYFAVKMRAWQEANREYRKEYNKEYHAKNRAHLLEEMRKWHLNNPERAREGSRRKYHANPSIYLTAQQRRRTRKLLLPSTLTAEQWVAILAAYKHRCAYCGKRSQKLEQEHVIPVSKGGGTVVDNIVPACRSCNATKQARIVPNPPMIRLMM